MKKAKDWGQLCPNPECEEYNKYNPGGIISVNSYQTQSGKRRIFKCKSCGERFAETRNTVLFDLRVPEEKIIMVLKMCVVAMSLSQISFVIGVREETILRWIERAYEQAERINAYLLKNLAITQVQIDEMWNFVKKKKLEGQKNGAEAPAGETEGRQWIWLSYAPQYCLLLTTVVGPRTKENAEKLIARIAQVVKGVPCFFSDGFSCYWQALVKTYHHLHTFPLTGKRGRPRKPVQLPHPELVYAQLVKTKVNGKLKSIDTRIRAGAEPLKSLGLKVSTSLVERLNLTLRTSIAPLVRKTNSFCKQQSTLRHRVVFFHAFYNFARPHMSLRLPLCSESETVPLFHSKYLARAPAMAAGITEHVWSFGELLSAKFPVV